MRTCFQRQFSSISCIFNSSKRVPVAKKWQKRREHVLTNCNHAKSDGNVVSTKAFASLQKIHFLIDFRFFSTCMAPKNTNTQHLTITLIIQAVKRETSQYFATGACFDKLYSHQKRWERVLATGRCLINWNWWKCDGNAFTKTHFSGL